MHDLIVIGGGTAGLVTAAGSAGLGARVALVEMARLGGECLWNGCVPSKALLAAAGVAHAARDGRHLGTESSGASVDFADVMRSVHDAQQRIAPHDSPERFRGLGVDVIEGQARFTGDRTIAVDSRRLEAKRIVVATGSRPAVPPIEGLSTVPYYTNETIFSLEGRPETLLVLGAGPIGLELAQAFARLGSTVHVLEAESELLPREDHELAQLLGDYLRQEGVHIHLGARVTRVERAGESGRVRVTTSPASGDVSGSQPLEGDVLLVATGRSARTDTLDLQRGSIEAGSDGVKVDDALRTTADGVWAAGDCVGPFRFTHVADYQARLVIRNAFFPLTSKVEYHAVPWVTFTDPELAHVGLTEREAREAHGDTVQVWRRPFGDVDRAIIDRHTAGLVKLITTSRGKIVGGHILGHGAGNMIGEITLAMKHGITAGALGNTMHPYPSYPEAIKQAAEGFTKARLKGPVKALTKWLVRR